SGTIAALVLDTVTSAGRATVERDSNGALFVRELKLQQRVEAALAGEPLHLDIAADKTDGSPTVASLRVAPFEMRKIAGAFPAAWPLKVAAFPVQIDATGRFAPGGVMVDGSANVFAGTGEILPWQPGLRPIAVRRATLEARAEQGGARVAVPRAMIEADIGTFRATSASIRMASDIAAVAGAIDLTKVNVAGIAASLLPSAEAMLREVGISPADLALDRSAARFDLEWRASESAGWKVVQADVSAEVQGGGFGKPLTVTGTLQLPRGSEDLEARAVFREFTPSDFGRRTVAGVNLGDLEFPLRLELGGRLAAATGQLESATMQLRAGPGKAVVAGLGGAIPFREAAIDAGIDVSTKRVTLPVARVELAPGLGAEVTGLEATLSPLRVTGVARWQPLSLVDAVAWWPASLVPDKRQRAVDAAPSGRLETGGIEFAFEAASPGGTLKLTRGEGELSLSNLALRVPGVPDRVEAERVKVRAAWPAAEVQAKAVRLPGAAISSAEFEIPDVTSARSKAKARMTLIGIPAEMEAWLRRMTVPAKLLVTMKASGPVRGELKATLAGSNDDFSGTEIELNLRAENLHVPELMEGPLDTRFRFHAPSRGTAVFDAALVPGEAKWVDGNRRSSFSPLTFQVVARDWRVAEKSSVEILAASEAFFGMPLRIKATTALGADGRTMQRAVLDEFVLGRTDLRAEWQVAPGHESLVVKAKAIDFGEIANAAAPWLDLVPTLRTQEPKP
ncbi:MAG: hypothetical protein ACREF9_17190, partial [Opitutaceae bacterium]